MSFAMTYTGPATLVLEDAQVEATVSLRPVYASVLNPQRLTPVAWEGEAENGQAQLARFLGRSACLRLPDGREAMFIGRNVVDGKLRLAGSGPLPFGE